MIQISAQYGDQKSTKFVRPFHKRLNELLVKIKAEKFFKTISKLSIVLRVSGEIWQFNGEGPERLKFLKKENEMTIDLLIPKTKWMAECEEEFKPYLEKGIRKCFEYFLKRAVKEKDLISENRIRHRFNNAMDEFNKMHST